MLSELVFLLLLLKSVQCEELPLVQTPLGSVRGYHKTSFDGRTFSAFEGIPYAKPPIGELRFDEPQLVDPWLGVWNATILSTCAQTSMMATNVTSGDEDCLHINVYVPRDHPNPSDTLDVIVHIHGGAYLYCSGHAYSRPEILMDQDVIFVTFNYRLGILGFLSTEDGIVPGNNGLKDQVQALKWVQQNIASFGGNPKSVTINGMSAGGSSVHLHYFSPLSRGLYQRGFAQSGFALNPWSIQEKPLTKAKQLAQAVGCPTDNTKKLVDCLKQRPFQQLLSQMPLFFTHMFLPAVPFGPVVEKGAARPFLSQDPYILLKNGEVYDVPLLASTSLHEGSFPVTYVGDTLDHIDKNWETLAPGFLEFNNTLPPSLWTSVSKRIKEHYLGKAHINKENYMKFIQIFTDRYFSVGAETSVRMQSRVVKAPIYYYVFEYPIGGNKEKMAEHGLDSIYYYGPVLRSEPLTPNEIKMKDLLVNMMVTFARTGKPVLRDLDWQPTKYEKLTYVRIQGVEPEEVTLETVDKLTPKGFWDSLGFHEGENLLSKRDEL